MDIFSICGIFRDLIRQLPLEILIKTRKYMITIVISKSNGLGITFEGLVSFHEIIADLIGGLPEVFQVYG